MAKYTIELRRVCEIYGRQEVENWFKEYDNENYLTPAQIEIITKLNIWSKERLITDEANSNNELINLNLQSYLAPRQEACRQFNEKFGFTGTDKEISVRVRSDLHNIIKNAESIVNDYKDLSELDKNLEGVE